jgi:phosphatidylglycerol:prolipoprotein diacylglycerol transferase
MRPVLFPLGTFPVYSYVVFAILAYLGGLAYAYLEARRVGQDPIYAVDLSLIIFFAGFVGARLLFVIVLYPRFLQAPLDIFKVWQGGLVFYGGLIAAVLAAAGYIKLRRLPLGTWADICSPSAMIALVFGRIGCLLNGCCYGKIANDLPWAITYPPNHPSLKLGLGQVRVHPTPAYESIAAFLIFLILLALTRRKRFEGELFFLMLILYAAARFFLEFYRGDTQRGSIPFLHLSTSQAVAVVMVMVALPYLFYRFRAAGSQGPAS